MVSGDHSRKEPSRAGSSGAYGGPPGRVRVTLPPPPGLGSNLPWSKRFPHANREVPPGITGWNLAGTLAKTALDTLAGLKRVTSPVPLVIRACGRGGAEQDRQGDDRGKKGLHGCSPTCSLWAF